MASWPAMKPWQSLLAALVIVACGRELPSSTPLGGKLDDGLSDGYVPDRRPRSDAGEVAEVSESRVEETNDKDAGPADAGVAKQEVADAGALDAASDAGLAEAKWAGEYVGHDVTIIREAGQPENRMPDPKARTRVEEKGNGRIDIIIVNSATGDPLCTLDASTRGASATIDANQDCFSDEMLDVNVESGSAELKGDRLILELKASFKGVSDSREGTIDYSFDGKRQ